MRRRQGSKTCQLTRRPSRLRPSRRFRIRGVVRLRRVRILRADRRGRLARGDARGGVRSGFGSGSDSRDSRERAVIYGRTARRTGHPHRYGNPDHPCNDGRPGHPGHPVMPVTNDSVGLLTSSVLEAPQAPPAEPEQPATALVPEEPETSLDAWPSLAATQNTITTAAIAPVIYADTPTKTLSSSRLPSLNRLSRRCLPKPNHRPRPRSPTRRPHLSTRRSRAQPVQRLWTSNRSHPHSRHTSRTHREMNQR